MIQKLTEKVAIPEGGVPDPKSKTKIHQEARRGVQCAAELHQQLPEKLQHARALANEKGTSSWITTLPLLAHGFELPKGSFCATLCLQYGWPVHLLSFELNYERGLSATGENLHAPECSFSLAAESPR